MTGLVRTPGAVAKRQSIQYALALGKRPDVAKPAFADGGLVSGPLIGTDGGRTDTLPIKVPSGSYVVPSDVVSGIPGAQGNSMAGHVALNKLMAQLPLSPDEAPYGASSPKLPIGKTIPGLIREERHLTRGIPVSARGGAHEGKHEGVDILAASGEHVIAPHLVKRIGAGSLKRGHAVLDRFVTWVRENNIKELKKLPGPVKS